MQSLYTVVGASELHSTESTPVTWDAEHISPLNIYRLTHNLQTSLNIETLLKLFSEELHASVEHRGVRFILADGSRQYRTGKFWKKVHSLSLRVPGDVQPIGLLEFSHTEEFTIYQQQLVGKLAENLVYPLRNALLYQRAVMSAVKDPLTGLNNRSLFDSTIQRERELAQRHKTDASIICADIDLFKQVNDRYGHRAGDEVIKYVGNALQACSRSTDSVFRYGGEEFVILLPNTDQQGATLLAERIRVYVESLVCRIDSHRIGITLSLGVHSLQEGDDATSWFNRADQALYQAKQNGRNQVCLAD